MTNKEKFIEVMNKTFDAGLTEENFLWMCSPCGAYKSGACEEFTCKGCAEWWDREWNREKEVEHE